jgi:N-acetylmuramoyl-L-alanine amidase
MKRGPLVLGVAAIFIGLLLMSVRSKKATDNVTPAPAKQLKAVAAKRPAVRRTPVAQKRLVGLAVVLDPGHGGTDPGAGWRETFVSKAGRRTERFWEASYTYIMVRELGELLRNEGAEVYFTEDSEVLRDSSVHAPNESAPLPRDASFSLDGSASRAGKSGLEKRAEIANQMLERFPPERVVFLSIHIDAMGPGYTGAHVCYDPVDVSPSQMAVILAQNLRDKGYGWKRSGVDKDMVRCQSLRVLNTCQAVNKALIEMSTPTTSADSWRLRSQRHRLQLLRVIRDSLVEWRRTSLTAATVPPR